LIVRNRGLLLLTVLTAVVALVITFPARVAYQWMSSPFVQMSGIQGTVWNGSAREFATNGVYLRELTWRMHPLGLFTGKANYDISGTPNSGFFESEVTLSLGGTLTLSNLSASVPLQMFEEASNIAGLRGNASLKFERLELRAGRAAAMDGTVDVANLSVPMLGDTSLGGYRAEFYTQNNGIVASVEDTDGVVDVAGSLQLNPDKTYAFRGQVVAKPNTPDNLTNQLRYLPTNDRGQHELSFEGQY
jgi:general secretion pathway protein N